MLQEILERYAIAIPTNTDVNLCASMDGVLLLVVHQKDRFIIPVGTFQPPTEDLPVAERFKYLAAIAQDPPRDSLLLSEEQIARTILCYLDSERARSPFWKYEDWSELEAESV